MRPRQRVFSLDRRVVEDFDSVRAANAGVAEAHRGKDGLLHARQPELLRQIAADRVGVDLIVGREDLDPRAHVVHQRR